MRTPSVHYTLSLAEPMAHRVLVSCRIENPAAEGHIFRLPTWIPGSYLIREFAKHVVEVHATQNGQTIEVRKIDKQRWQTESLPTHHPLTFQLWVHAWDLSVRGAHFDQRHAFINGSAVFPAVEGLTDAPCTLDILPAPVPGGETWQVFTGLTPTHGLKPAPKHLGHYRADDYAALLDHPLEIGPSAHYAVLAFTAHGIPHRMVIRGASHFNAQRFQRDLNQICQTTLDFFQGEANFDRYDFLLTVAGDVYGGLEHRNSTALLANRDDLPALTLPDDQAPGEGYQRLLGLCAHEYFHAWLVKGLRDEALSTSKLSQEAYTTLLWFFEGFTSYYDTLMLVRAQVISHAAFLAELEKTLRQISTPGQYRQSLAESSYDAWIKFYRPDDNTPNSVVSYYGKGSLVALLLDLKLRQQGLSADAWLQRLWHDFGTHTPLTETRLLAHLQDFADEATATQLSHWVHQAAELPLAESLASVGIHWHSAAQTQTLAWGLKTTAEAGWVRITHVLDGSPAQALGLAAGDLLVAINALRVSPNNLELRLQTLMAEPTVTIDFFREDHWERVQGNGGWRPAQTVKLAFSEQPTPEQLKALEEWLGCQEVNRKKNIV